MKRLLLSMTAVVLLFTVAGCGAGGPQTDAARDDALLGLWPLTTSSAEARREIADGVREFDMNRGDVAYEHFKRAIAADPNFAMAELYASWSAQGGPEEGLAHINRAVELASNASEVERLIIQLTKKDFDGNREGLLADAQQLVKIDANNARSWDLLAYAYDEVRDRAQARAARERAMEIAPGLAYLPMIQSFSYSVLEPSDFVKAEQYARRAVELAPGDEAVYDILGDALRAQGKLEEAAQAYTRCAELDPTKGDALQQRGHVQTFLGRYAEARADYDAAVALETGNRRTTLAMYRAFVHLHEGQPQAAVAELEQLYASIEGANIPNPTGARQGLLNDALRPITTHLRMVPEAERVAQRSVQLNELQMQRVTSEEFRRRARAFNALNLGYLELAKGNYAAARQKAAEYMKIREPDQDPAKNIQAHVLLGTIAFGQNRFDESVQHFEQGNPDNDLMAYYHAQALEKLGRTAEAQRMYNRLANRYFNSIGIALIRKDVLARVKQQPAT